MAKKRAPLSRRSAVSRRGRPRIEEITGPQQRALTATRSHIRQRGFPPTIKELGDELGVSAASAHELVAQLIRKGYARREPGKARSLEILKAPRRARGRG